jgi:hypothetical protein
MVDVTIASAAAVTMSTVMPMVPTAMAAAAVIHIARTSTVTDASTTITAVATVTGDGLAVTAQQGDADNREKNRDA